MNETVTPQQIPLNKGILVAVEGMEGSGKDTVTALLTEAFRKLGVDAVSYYLFDATEVGKTVKAAVTAAGASPMTPDAEMLLMMAAHTENVNLNIIPALNQSKLVVTNRYVDSTRVYQGYVKGCNESAIDIVSMATLGDIQPMITFQVAVDSLTARNRVMVRGNLDKHEAMPQEFYNAIWNGYNKLYTDSPFNRVVIFNNSHDPEMEKLKEHVEGAALKFLINLGQIGYLPDALHRHLLETQIEIGTNGKRLCDLPNFSMPAEELPNPHDFDGEVPQAGPPDAIADSDVGETGTDTGVRIQQAEAEEDQGSVFDYLEVPLVRKIN